MPKSSAPKSNKKPAAKKLHATVISKDLLRLLPVNRQKEKRTLQLTLDELIDDYRKLYTMSSSELDFLLMAYRFEFPFQAFLKKFLRGKKIKPEELIDLWQLAFASLLTRKEDSLAQLTHAWVEASKSFFGVFTASLTNAFCRSILREKESLLKMYSQSPDKVLGPTLSKRWEKLPELKKRFAKKILERPSSGISVVTQEGKQEVLTAKDFKAGTHLAMNPGSYRWISYVKEEISKNTSQNLKVLDACAAPGGKLIALLNMLPTLEATAVEAKFKRLERLKENIQSWNLDKRVKCQLHDWSTPLENESFHVILADLPCTGLGTLASRPDLLLKDWSKEDKELFALQEKIINALQPHLAKGGKLFVSICSSDPSEVQHLSQLLKQKPSFMESDNFDSNKEEENSEEITGWVIIKE